ncbi:MAG: ribosome biogenesis GTPase Der [Thermoanaerobaculia bacterium]|nr:ribosome biogenesis GTPase Der [Thermoanaerobaculia bacterium]
MSQLPTVAIVGRPNVGKSTLWNRLAGRKKAIVHDQPGVTRDRMVDRVELEERAVHLVDTGGLVPGDDPLGLGEQVRLAVEESDVLLLVVDGKEGRTAADERIWQELRPYGKPTILLVNKGDTKAADENFHDFYRMGVGEQVKMSAEHGLGLPDLHEVLLRHLPAAQDEGELDDAPALAVVGRPNVGKSSVVNRLVGESRVLVSPVAGTTRDPIDSVLEVGDKRYRLVDTAGIRRRSQVTGFAEEIAVLFAKRQIERADVVLLVVDASQGITSGDLAIAGEAWDQGRAVVVVLNKWDLLDEELREELENDWPRLDTLLGAPARVNVSALSGRRLDRLLPAVDAAIERSRLELSTSQVNRFFEAAVQRHQPPQVKGRPWRIYYATQVKTAPPTFMVFANRTLERSDPYRRYLENRLREEHDLAGVPVRLVIRRRT